MKENLINKIALALAGKELDIQEIKLRLYLIMKDYSIQPAETALAIRDENKNAWLINRFLIAKSVKGCTERTLEFYQINLNKVLDRIGKDADQITSDDIRLYVAVRERKDGVSRVTVHNEYRVLSSFFQWMTLEGIAKENPILRLGLKQPKSKRKEAFTEVEVAKIKGACKGYKEQAIVELLFSTGCRVSELVGIKKADIDGTKILVHGKGEKDRYVYLNASAMVALEKYLAELPETPNPYLFPRMVDLISKAYVQKGRKKKEYHNLYSDPDFICNEGHMDKGTVEQITRKIGKRSGVANCHPHRFRRTCATLALRRGMSLIHVSQMLGHNQLDTTKIYLDLSEKDLEYAHEKYVN